MTSLLDTAVTSAGSNDQAPNPDATAPPTPHPVPILPGRAAQAMCILHPALLVGVLLYNFNDLVTEPPSALSSTLPAVAAIQIAYAVLCLTPTGTPPARATRKPRRGEKKTRGLYPDPLVTALLSLALSFPFTFVVYLVFVLFGAPFLTHVPHTLLLAGHASLLALFPLFYTHGVESRAWRVVAAAAAPFDEAFGGLVGAAAGAWLGAIPIPLDWDRDWQRWPVTIVVGMWAGYLLGKVVGGTVAYGRRFAVLPDETNKKKEQ